MTNKKTGSQKKKAQAHVIGGGVAGYVSAIALLRAGFDTHLWEKEEKPFSFSSSRNSAMARSYEADPYLSYLLKESLFMMSGEDSPHQPFIEPAGLLIHPMEYDCEEESFFEDHPGDPEVEPLKSRESSVILPDGERFSGFLLPGNGFLNLKNIHRYLREEARGIHEFFYREITRINTCVERTDRGNKNEGYITQIKMTLPNHEKAVFALEKNDILVNAAGSWAFEIMQKNGILSPRLMAHKRHMFLLENPENWFANSPIIWDEVEDFYIRYHPEGILISPCDETIARPSDYQTDDSQPGKLEEVLKSKFTFLQRCRVKEHWSCLRTFTLDNRPVVGFDPKIQNLFWSAGWGGRGISMAFGMIGVIKNLLSQGYQKDEQEYDNPYTVSRFF